MNGFAPMRHLADSFFTFRLNADQVQRQCAAMRAAAMLEEVDALPCAERESAVDQRDRQLDLRERGAEVGWHVVRAFIVVEILSRFGRYAGEIGFQVGPDFGRGVFLDEERGGGVAAEYRQQTFRHLLFAEPADDLVGDINEALAGCVKV